MYYGAWSGRGGYSYWNTLDGNRADFINFVRNIFEVLGVEIDFRSETILLFECG